MKRYCVPYTREALTTCGRWLPTLDSGGFITNEITPEQLEEIKQSILAFANEFCRIQIGFIYEWTGELPANHDSGFGMNDLRKLINADFERYGRHESLNEN